MRGPLEPSRGASTFGRLRFGVSLGGRMAQRTEAAVDGRLDELVDAISETFTAITPPPNGESGLIELGLDVVGTRPGGSNPLSRSTWTMVAGGVVHGLTRASFRKGSIEWELGAATSWAVIAAGQLATDRDPVETVGSIDTAHEHLAAANRPRSFGGTRFLIPGPEPSRP